MRCFRAYLLIVIGLCAALGSRSAQADLPPPSPLPRPASTLLGDTPGMMCRRAINAAGRNAGIPEHLMSAIARVESGRRGPDGVIHPWPWSINVEGVDHIYDTREQAIAAVRGFQAQGVRSIDVGCMQVNLMHHAHAFASLEQAFDPSGNAVYAASFLSQLYGQTGTWPKATATYHSATPDRGDAYQRKVMAVLAEETQTDLATLGSGGLASAPGRVAALGPIASGSGALMLGNRAEAARIIPQVGGEMRGLDAYRATPVRVAGR